MLGGIAMNIYQASRKRQGKQLKELARKLE